MIWTEWEEISMVLVTGDPDGGQALRGKIAWIGTTRF